MGRLTGESFVPNFFRANISGPMGARAVSLYLRDAPFKNFYGLGMDYAWGRNSVAVFESEMKRANKNFVGAVFSPTGTKDFSTYITKIRNSGADAMYFALAGDDLNAFLVQAKQYRLGEKVQIADRGRRYGHGPRGGRGGDRTGWLDALLRRDRYAGEQSVRRHCGTRNTARCPTTTRANNGRRARFCRPGSRRRAPRISIRCGQRWRKSRSTASRATSRCARAITRWCSPAISCALKKARPDLNRRSSRPSRESGRRRPAGR